MCEECGRSLMIDHVTEGGKYVYICTNPKCKNYRKALTLTGEEYDALIKTKRDKKER